MSTAIETYRGVVYPWQMDHMGHMNVRFYSARFDEATWRLLKPRCRRWLDADER